MSFNLRDIMQKEIADHVEEIQTLTGNGVDSLQRALGSMATCISRSKSMELQVPHFRSRIAVGHMDKGAPLNKADLRAKASDEYKLKIDAYESAVKEEEEAKGKVVHIRARLKGLEVLISLEQSLARLAPHS